MSNKRKFDGAVVKTLGVVDKKKEQKAIKEAFKEFIDLEIPSLVDVYEWKGTEVLLKVFKYKPKKENIQVSFELNSKGDTIQDTETRYFSFAKVFAAGPDSPYKVGEIVKLRDVDTMSIETQKYREWVDNPYSKSNLKQVGEEPQRYLSNIFPKWGPHVFVLNPLNVEDFDLGEDDDLYKRDAAVVENRIKDVTLLF